MEPSCPDAARGPPPPLEGPEDAATESGPSRSAAAPEENRHPPLCPPTSSSGPGGAALPSQLHPSPLEPSLSLVPGSAQGGGPEWVPPPPPFGDHTPPSSQSSMASSGSEQTKKLAGGRNTCKEEGSGMKDVPSWLESLGLQEYTALFSQMTYEEMMSLTEHHLESQVTQECPQGRAAEDPPQHPEAAGAAEHLQGAGETAPHPDDTSDRAPPGATNAKDPTAPVPDGDIPGQFTRVMGKVCAQLLESRPYKKYITSYLQLLEQCLSHEAFTETQKKRLRCCGGKVQWLLRTFPLGADQQLAPGPARPPPGASPPRHGPGDQPHA
ncbi:protein Smaug homolog 2-like isoform X2 [Athene noctua]|uniref:protein Smaug homolog 2-like isoform X2 n=1 Tax=Athene noctua TaxID=126797 RepID=UPI003EBADA40